MTRSHPLIALADDDPACLRMLNEVLADEGYATVCCRSERETYEHVMVDQPDLLIVDLRMDEPTSGVRIVEKLRAHAGTRHLPVLVCSADLVYLRERAQQIRRLGCELLEKPFDLDELLAKVAAACGSLPAALGTLPYAVVLHP
jgi:DNA-binding response OmpR family regulator